MNYPIFNSIVNRIEAELLKRNIKIKTFRTWKENTINATGLELVIDIHEMSSYINSVTINFDWDKFKEICLAKQLTGMEKHPLLQEKPLLSTNVKPNIDIEITWHFDKETARALGGSDLGTDRLETASQWMDTINRRNNQLMTSDNIITRWHIEVEGDINGRYISEMRLISYFQYTFEGLRSLNEIHSYINKKLQTLLMTTLKVINIANESIPNAA